MSRKEDKESDFFQRIPWHQMILVPSGVALLTLAALKPDMVPYDRLGPLRLLVAKLVAHHPTLLTVTCYLTWIAHFLEAIYAVYLARSKNINPCKSCLWGIQTLFYGVFSLSLLRAHKTRKD